MPPRARPSGPLAHKELRETLDYNPETGWLTLKVRRSRIQKGARAGGQHGKGHRALIVAGFGFLEHRLSGIMKRGENSYRVRVNDGQGRRLSFTAHSYLAARRLRNRLEKQYWGEFACARR